MLGSRKDATQAGQAQADWWAGFVERSGWLQREGELPGDEGASHRATVRPFTTPQACQVLRAAPTLSVVGTEEQHTK